jgi:hypothetical protein
MRDKSSIQLLFVLLLIIISCNNQKTSPLPPTQEVEELNDTSFLESIIPEEKADNAHTSKLDLNYGMEWSKKEIAQKILDDSFDPSDNNATFN